MSNKTETTYTAEENERDAKRFRQLMGYHSWRYSMTHDQPMECGVSMEFQQRRPDEDSVTIEWLLDEEIAKREKDEAEEGDD